MCVFLCRLVRCWLAVASGAPDVLCKCCAFAFSSSVFRVVFLSPLLIVPSLTTASCSFVSPFPISPPYHFLVTSPFLFTILPPSTAPLPEPLSHSPASFPYSLPLPKPLSHSPSPYRSPPPASFSYFYLILSMCFLWSLMEKSDLFSSSCRHFDRWGHLLRRLRHQRLSLFPFLFGLLSAFGQRPRRGR